LDVKNFLELPFLGSTNLKSSAAVSLDEIHGEQYGKIICYPKFDIEELKSRLMELRGLKVSRIEFSGQTRIFDLNILGKGHVSIVVVAYANGKRCALKIRRTDADRLDMSHEVEALRAVNAVGIGPTAYGSSKNFILMELIEGVYFPEWLVSVKGKGRKKRVQRVLRMIIEECWKLDKAEIDHGELSRASRHVIVEGDRPRIIDFESASTARRRKNVTSICQFLFIGSKVSRLLRRVLPNVNGERLVDALRFYKVEPTEKGLEKIFETCGL